VVASTSGEGAAVHVPTVLAACPLPCSTVLSITSASSSCRRCLTPIIALLILLLLADISSVMLPACLPSVLGLFLLLLGWEDVVSLVDFLFFSRQLPGADSSFASLIVLLLLLLLLPQSCVVLLCFIN
jgi:hypothetical protein